MTRTPSDETALRELRRRAEEFLAREVSASVRARLLSDVRCVPESEFMLLR
jgi:hypothetical protein